MALACGKINSTRVRAGRRRSSPDYFPPVPTAVDRSRLALVGEVLHRFGEARLRVTGSSMLPSIWPGDELTVRRRAVSELRTGEIALFTRMNDCSRIAWWRTRAAASSRRETRCRRETSPCTTGTSGSGRVRLPRRTAREVAGGAGRPGPSGGRSRPPLASRQWHSPARARAARACEQRTSGCLKLEARRLRPEAPVTASTDQLSTAIASAGDVRVHASDPEFLRMLEERYQGFTGDWGASDYDFTVDLVDPGAAASADDEPRVWRDNGLWRLERGDFSRHGTRPRTAGASGSPRTPTRSTPSCASSTR